MKVALPSSFFLMSFPNGREMIFSDCAVNVAPDAQALASIARASSGLCQGVAWSRRRGSFVVLNRNIGQRRERFNRERGSGANKFLGPSKADAALNAAIAQKKGLGEGRANVLVFPNLDAGNIAYKLAQELAGAKRLVRFTRLLRNRV